MHKLAFVTLLGLASAGFAVPCGAADPGAGAVVVGGKMPGAAAVAGAVEVRATVESIDLATRRLVLKFPPDGRTGELIAGDEVKNLDQVRAGDTVSVRYVRAVALSLKKGTGGIRERSEGMAEAKSEKGAMPGASATREVRIVADVVAVDAAKKTVTLKGPKGRIVDVDVADPEVLKQVRKGDQVEATYTEALAVGVERVSR
jgi:hypothetical protein